MHELAPTQQRALDALLAAIKPGRVVTFIAPPGSGKTTILEAAYERLGGRWIAAGDLEAAVAARHPLSLEDAFHHLVDNAVVDAEVVFVDDLHLLLNVIEACHSYPRGGFVNLAMKALSDRARAIAHTIVVTVEHPFPSTSRIEEQVGMKAFDVDDYRAVVSAYLDSPHVKAIDFPKVHRFAKHMTAAQLRRAATGIRATLETNPGADATDAFIDYLKAAQLVSNVDLGEVQTVRLEDLRGLDDVLRALEANVILPLEHGELATELALKPKRGVLLVGPPGTGKTTIGRALAHRLRGKFFLIDGTMIAGTPMFYQQRSRAERDQP